MDQTHKLLEQLPDTVMQKLTIYNQLLCEWQKKINLVGPSTIEDSWKRHFIDSIQLNSYLPETAKTLIDLGSGAGFPGMVLAILCPALSCHLVESDLKKCAFLRTVSRETETAVTIHDQRIEHVSRETMISPDIITARALASLDRLFLYVEPWIIKNDHTRLLFPKGEQFEQEITEIEKKWSFSLQKHDSQTSDNGQILIFSEINSL